MIYIILLYPFNIYVMQHLQTYENFNNEIGDIQPLSHKIYTQAEMVKMGGNYHFHHGILAMIPVEKIDGLDPEPSDWHDDLGNTMDFRPGQEIKKPIEVWYDELNDKYMLYDGNHRVKQAKVNSDKYIKAFVQAESRELYNKLLGKKL